MVVAWLKWQGWSRKRRVVIVPQRIRAITSRPLLLAAVGMAANHANPTALYLTPLNGRHDVLKGLT